MNKVIPLAVAISLSLNIYFVFGISTLHAASEVEPPGLRRQLDVLRADYEALDYEYRNAFRICTEHTNEIIDVMAAHLDECVLQLHEKKP